MNKQEDQILKSSRKLGFKKPGSSLYELADWLREEKQIHVEIGSIWDDLVNRVESYYYTVTAPLNVYYTPAIQRAGGASYKEMLAEGIEEALGILAVYNQQKHLKISDDQVVIAYLKGYGDKSKPAAKNNYTSNLEKYAYLLGKQGDYIEEGLTEDDILYLVKNKLPDEEMLQLE
ncbi:MAG: hypothetical protein R3209_03610 [Salinimicrobium sediminis]|nr:hypothetical protein [Salinimicrobium sediminis]